MSDQIDNILILRLSAIGDIVFSSPLIHSFRQRYPQARICWMVQPECKPLLERHAELDEVIVWPRGEWQRLWRERKLWALWREVIGFRRRLKAHQFDLALDVQGLMKSGFLTWLSGARQRIGLGSREGSHLLMSRVLEKGGDPRRISSEYRQFAQDLELPAEPFDMRVGLDDADRARAAELIDQHALEAGYVVICPFTTRPQKHWFSTAWQQLIKDISQRWKMPVVMLGGPGDLQAASAISASEAALPVNLVGGTSLREAAAIIARASLVVGVDTGLTHMGIAMQRPTLCLFGSTRPYLDTGQENAKVIYHALECSPCRRKPTCNGAFDCMREITPGEVMSEAQRLPGFREGIG
jgi:heptosyltransferase-1